jgi:L-serine dehydratase
MKGALRGGIGSADQRAAESFQPIRYYRGFYEEANKETALSALTAATISGNTVKRVVVRRQVSCQGGLASPVRWPQRDLPPAGGSNAQIEIRARSASNHLGMSCDPVAGLESDSVHRRNAMSAVKAINAASLALRGDGAHQVALDAVIGAMYETGRDR